MTVLYGYGLFASEDSAVGRFVSHSGGYPGFGSHMRWHPASGYGIIALSNRTYGPVYDLAAEILEEVALCAPAPDVASSLWAATRDAMNVAERLLSAWDDALADASFAVNIDLDTPRSERRSAVARVAGEIGPFARINTGWSSLSAAHVKWRVSGERADAELEILLTPEAVPKIQSFSVSKVDAAGSGG